ncbi:cytochrome-c peroxidase, partial [Nitrosomonas communis]
MACVTCHDPRAGWTGPHSQTNLTQVAITGANPHTIGNRKPPASAYASFIPPFQEGVVGPPSGVLGGAFWDGRA